MWRKILASVKVESLRKPQKFEEFLLPAAYQRLSGASLFLNVEYVEDFQYFKMRLGNSTRNRTSESQVELKCVKVKSSQS